MFQALKAGLQEPLQGMGTAFSSSLFGLGGSLILGFIDIQANHAQNRFFNELEEWLSGVTQLVDRTLADDFEEDQAAFGGSAPGDVQMSRLIEELHRTNRQMAELLHRTAGQPQKEADGPQRAVEE